MPWMHPLNNRDEVRRIIDAGIPDIKAGLGKRCFDTASYYMETFASHPKLEKAISIYHPDL